MADDANDLLMRSGSPSAKFETIGDTISGTIVEKGTSQRRDFKTNDLLWWDDAKTEPQMQVVITLATDLRDPEIEGDDGTRRIFASAWAKPGSMFEALRTAVKAAGASGIEIGGKLGVQFYGEEPSSQKGNNPRKLYRAQYQAPAAAAADDLLSGGAAPAPQATTEAPAAGVPTDSIF